MEEMHLGRMESIGVWFLLVLKWDALVSICCCLAHPMLPRTTMDITNDITITLDLLVLSRCIINGGVNLASEEFPIGTAMSVTWLL